MKKINPAPQLIILYLLIVIALSRTIEITTGNDLRLVYFCTIALFLVLHPLVSYGKGKFDPFELINIFLLVYAFSYFLRPLFLLVKPELSAFREYWRWTEFNKGLFYSSFALGAFYLGYYSSYSKFFCRFYPKINSRAVASRGFLAFWLMLGISITAFWIHIILLGGLEVFLHSLIYKRAQMYLGYGWLTPFQTLGMVAIPVGYGYMIENIKARPLFLFGGLVVLGLLLMIMSRGFFLTWIVMLIVYKHYYKSYIPVKKILIYGLILWSLMISLLWLRHYPLGVLHELPLPDKTLLAFSQTFNGFDNAMMVLNNYPDPHPLFYGKTILESFLYPWIPRAIWKSKPLSYGGTAITEPIGGFFMYGTHVSAEMISELYANFTWVGVFMGMTLIGMVARSLYLHFIAYNTSNKAHILIYAYLVALVPGLQRLGLGGAVYYFLQFLLPFIVILSWVHGGLLKTKQTSIRSRSTS